jgi:hypothetical protein
MDKQAKCVDAHESDGRLVEGAIYIVRDQFADHLGNNFVVLKETGAQIWGAGRFEILPTIEEAQKKALKFDSGKPRLELLPTAPIMAIGRVLTKGAIKYHDHNWRNGFHWSRLLGAAFRHLFLWSSGEDKDPETGESHLAHAGCCILFLLEHEEKGLGEDDRFKAS